MTSKKAENQPTSSDDNAESTTESAQSTNTNRSAFTVEHLRRYLAEKFSLSDSKDDDVEETEKGKSPMMRFRSLFRKFGRSICVLEEVSLDGIVDFIRKKNCKNIITMAGAGISTSAGIPDFRSPGTGLYDNLQKYNLPHPQAIFELEFFGQNPKPFFELAKELYPGSFKPTVCHYFIRMLIDKGMLLRHYTQNIDTLERVAGIPDDKIVEAHGTFHTGHCLECRHEYTMEWMKERIFKDEVPICEECPGVVKPDIVFFGESLPDKFHKLLRKDFPKCDLLIVLGSSLAVQPFASLVDKVSSNVPRLLINMEKVGQRSGFVAMLGLSGGMDFDSKNNSRDVCWLGTCDEGCQLLADKLGFGEELRELCKTEHEKIDKSEEVKPKEKEVKVNGKDKTKKKVEQKGKKSKENLPKL